MMHASMIWTLTSGQRSVPGKSSEQEISALAGSCSRRLTGRGIRRALSCPQGLVELIESDSGPSVLVGAVVVALPSGALALALLSRGSPIRRQSRTPSQRGLSFVHTNNGVEPRLEHPPLRVRCAGDARHARGETAARTRRR